MILTCPECATRYFVPDESLGGSGRTVRCASCKTSWRATAEEPLELSASPDEGATVAREPKTFGKPTTPDPAELSAPELPKAFRAKAQQARRFRAAAVAGAVWGVLGAVALGLLGSAYVFRTEVVEMMPSAAGAYAMAGLTVNPTGLEFRDLKAEPIPGEPRVRVTGRVENVRDEARPAPPILVKLLDSHGKTVSARTLRLPDGDIDAGKAAPFDVVMDDPNAATANVDLQFVLAAAHPPAKGHARPAAKGAPAHGHAKADGHAPASAEQAGLRAGAPAETHPAEAAKPLSMADVEALDSHGH